MAKQNQPNPFLEEIPEGYVVVCIDCGHYEFGLTTVVPHEQIEEIMFEAIAKVNKSYGYEPPSDGDNRLQEFLLKQFAFADSHRTLSPKKEDEMQRIACGVALNLYMMHRLEDQKVPMEDVMADIDNAMDAHGRTWLLVQTDGRDRWEFAVSPKYRELIDLNELKGFDRPSVH
jgi:hypothetical protein